MRIERRLEQPRWLKVAVPVGSVLFAFALAAIVLEATGHDALSSYRRIGDAAFVSTGAFGQTARDHEPCTALAGARHPEDRLDGLLSRLFDERARVHHDDVGAVGCIDQGIAGGLHLPEHQLGIDLVLRATEGEEA